MVLTTPLMEEATLAKEWPDPPLHTRSDQPPSANASNAGPYQDTDRIAHRVRRVKDRKMMAVVQLPVATLVYGLSGTW